MEMNNKALFVSFSLKYFNFNFMYMILNRLLFFCLCSVFIVGLSCLLFYLCLCLNLILKKTAVIRLVPVLIQYDLPHLNLVTSLKTLFLNQVIFMGVGIRTPTYPFFGQGVKFSLLHMVFIVMHCYIFSCCNFHFYLRQSPVLQLRLALNFSASAFPVTGVISTYVF